MFHFGKCHLECFYSLLLQSTTARIYSMERLSIFSFVNVLPGPAHKLSLCQTVQYFCKYPSGKTRLKKTIAIILMQFFVSSRSFFKIAPILNFSDILLQIQTRIAAYNKNMKKYERPFSSILSLLAQKLLQHPEKCKYLQSVFNEISLKV